MYRVTIAWEETTQKRVRAASLEEALQKARKAYTDPAGLGTARIKTVAEDKAHGVSVDAETLDGNMPCPECGHLGS